MSDAKEQAIREFVLEQLENLGMPDKGTMHQIVQTKGEEDSFENVAILDDSEPETAVVCIIKDRGDMHYYDRQGYQVYAE